MKPLAFFLAYLLPLSTVYAGSATWSATPLTGDWNTATNWMPPTIPNGPADVATFDVSNTTDISVSTGTEVNSIVFNSGASAFSITVMPGFTLATSGAGIINDSGRQQNFITGVDDFLIGGEAGNISFTGTATAGSHHLAPRRLRSNATKTKTTAAETNTSVAKNVLIGLANNCSKKSEALSPF